MTNNKLTAVVKPLLFSVLLVVSYLSLVAPVDAAKLTVRSENQIVGKDQEFIAHVFLDAGSDEINAVEGTLLFPAAYFELTKVIDGDSIVSLWLERPHLSEKQRGGKDALQGVYWSGIMPGGFRGILTPKKEGWQPGKIFSVIFKAKELGTGIIRLDAARALRHDGTGEEAHLVIEDFPVRITTRKFAVERTPEDTSPPETFLPELAQDPEIYDGRWFLVFSTRDSLSGIERFEVAEAVNPPVNTRLLTWKAAESPYLLTDQDRGSYIYVKAIDRSGNERITMLSPTKHLGMNDTKMLWVIISIGVLAFTAFGFSRISWIKKFR